MKFRIGALVAVVVAALLIVPPLLGRVSAGNKAEIVLQLDNAQALKDGEMQSIAAEDGKALAPLRVDGSTMLPLRWLAGAMGLTAEWDDAAKSTTLTDEHNKKTHIVFAIDDANMTVGEETKTLSAPATLIGGATYVPLRAIGEACGWNVSFVDDAKGALIFMDNRKKAKEPSEEQVTAALQKLGPSRVQMLTGGLVGRVGSGTVIVNGSRVEMKNADEKYVGAVAEQSVRYLPLDETMRALGGSAAEEADGSYTVSLDETENKLTSENLYTDDNQTTYANIEALSAALKLNCAVSGDAFALTALPVEAFPDKMAYLASLSATLPDKRPDIPDAKGYIALTFDDGPTGGSDGMTALLLDGLKARGAHATFFMCGYRIKDFHTHMERYLAEGHELGNHSMNHPMKPILAKLPVPKICEEITSNSDLIKSYTGQGTTVMRPVGGTVTDNLKTAMAQVGQPIINWSVDTLDWKYRDASRIKNVIVSQARDGDIVLMHDLHDPTLDGVLAAIDELQAQGYAFVTVSELAQIKGITLEPGKVYTGFGANAGYAG